MKCSLFIAILLCAVLTPVYGQHTCYVFIGSYTEGKPGKGIYVCSFDAENGSLTKISNTENIINPSFLTLAPNGAHLYACTETQMPNEGSVSAFAFDSVRGKLTFINKQPSGGENPVYATVDKTNKWLINGNYTEASVAAHGINEDGSLQPMGQLITFTDSSVNRERQNKAHIHAAVFSPMQDYLYLPDLGADKIRIFGFDASLKEPLQQSSASYIKTKEGSGPRHFAFHPNGRYAYCIEELSGTIAAYRYNNGRLDSLQTIFSYSEPQKVYGSADVHISPDGLFLYASNRVSENTISIFSIDTATGRLTSAGFRSTLGNHPRNFAISPDGKYVLVANQLSNSVVVLKRDTKTGQLTTTGIRLTIPHPSYLLMRPYQLKLNK